MIQSIARILRTEPRRALVQGVRAAQVVGAATAALRELGGSNMAAAAEIRSFKDGRLTIWCRSPLVGQEIMLSEGVFLDRLHKRLGYSAVKKLVFTQTLISALPEPG